MPTDLPQRPVAHQLADESVRFFRNCLPAAWTCDAPQNDYGVDLRVGLASAGRLGGRALVVQIKSTLAAPAGNSVPLRLQVSTLNYLRDLLEVAMLVKYVASEHDAYWLLLKDVPAPNPTQKTVTIRLPRANRLSQNPWEPIAEHVAAVHFRKLRANMQAME